MNSKIANKFFAAKELHEFKSSVINQGYNLIDTEIPQKINGINIILDSELFSGNYIKDVSKTNEVLMDMAKQIIWKLEEDTSYLKLWIKLMIPKIENSKSLGVHDFTFQKNLLIEIIKAEEEAAALYDNLSQHSINRARLASEVDKHPKSFDYLHAMKEFDEKAFRKLKISIRKVRDYYCILHDVITKNLNRVKNPVTENTKPKNNFSSLTKSVLKSSKKFNGKS